MAGTHSVSRSELDASSFLARSAAVHPDRVAVVCGERRGTYAELRERTNRLACALRACGIERHDRVAALCPNIPALLELHHAVQRRGRCSRRSTCASIAVRCEQWSSGSARDRSQ